MIMIIIILLGVIFRWAKRNVRRIVKTKQKKVTVNDGTETHNFHKNVWHHNYL